MRRSSQRWVAAFAAVVMLAGCAIAQVETPDPGAIPDHSLVAEGATGPIVVLGSGRTLDLGWRYAIYPSAEGWCTQLEMGGMTASACGDPLPTGDDAFGMWGPLENEMTGVTVVDGIVSPETATVWLIAADGRRAPADLMPLAEAGLDGSAFLGFVPPDVELTHLQAVAFNGDVLETVELD